MAYATGRFAVLAATSLQFSTPICALLGSEGNDRFADLGKLGRTAGMQRSADRRLTTPLRSFVALFQFRRSCHSFLIEKEKWVWPRFGPAHLLVVTG
jgi:hypothetical protein